MSTKKNDSNEQAQVPTVDSGIVSGKDGVTVANPNPEALEQAAENNPQWKENFPQANAAHAARDEYAQTADERRIQAERAANLEEANREKLNDDPHPTGDSVDPHAKDPALEKHGEEEPELDADKKDA